MTEQIIDPLLLDLLLWSDRPLLPENMFTYHSNDLPQVRTELERLQRVGCRLEQQPTGGLQLVEAAMATWSDYLQWRRPGRLVEVYGQISSTQDAARRLVESAGMAADGAVTIANEQTAGRGRLGRRWLAPAGTAVLLTRMAFLGHPDTVIDRLTLIAPVAVARAIEAACGGGVRVQIKWPNDLLIDDLKVGGILIETFVPKLPGNAPLMAALIGVGINVHLQPKQVTAELTGRITALSMCGHQVDRLALITRVLETLDQALLLDKLEDLLADWRRRCMLLSEHVRLRADGKIVQGQVIDLDPAHGLIVRTNGGQMVHLPAATTSLEEPKTKERGKIL